MIKLERIAWQAPGGFVLHDISLEIPSGVYAVLMGSTGCGKTSLLDAIRSTTVVEGESGRITQAIGASIIPVETLKRVCGKLIEKFDMKVPGLLFIDTPGHAAFTNLRKRGGALAKKRSDGVAMEGF